MGARRTAVIVIEEGIVARGGDMYVLRVNNAKAPGVVAVCTLAGTVRERGIIQRWDNIEWRGSSRVWLEVAGIGISLDDVEELEKLVDLRRFCLDNAHIDVLGIDKLVLIEHVVLNSCANTMRMHQQIGPRKPNGL